MSAAHFLDSSLTRVGLRGRVCSLAPSALGSSGPGSSMPALTSISVSFTEPTLETALPKGLAADMASEVGRIYFWQTCGDSGEAR